MMGGLALLRPSETFCNALSGLLFLSVALSGCGGADGGFEESEDFTIKALAYVDIVSERPVDDDLEIEWRLDGHMNIPGAIGELGGDTFPERGWPVELIRASKREIEGDLLKGEITVLSEVYGESRVPFKVLAEDTTIHIRLEGGPHHPTRIAEETSPPEPRRRANPTPSPPRQTEQAPPRSEPERRVRRPVETAPARSDVVRLRVDTHPSGGEVRIRTSGSANQTIFDTVVSTPAAFSIPPGLYEWEAVLPGFLTETSGDRLLHLRDPGEEELVIPLTASAGQDNISMAEREMSQGNWQLAADLLEAVDRPARLEGQAGREYVRSRLLLADAQVQLEEWDRALRVLEQVLDLDPDQYSARILTGQIHCELGDFAEGVESLRGLKGRFQNTIPYDRREAVLAVATFRIAECNYKEFRMSGEQALRMKALTSMQAFWIESGDAMERGQAPRYVLEELAMLMQEASEIISELEG